MSKPLLEGRRELVTGGASGIGRATAAAFLAAGAEVVVADRDPRVQDVTASIGAVTGLVFDALRAGLGDSGLLSQGANQRSHASPPRVSVIKRDSNQAHHLPPDGRGATCSILMKPGFVSRAQIACWFAVNEDFFAPSS